MTEEVENTWILNNWKSHNTELIVDNTFQTLMNLSLVNKYYYTEVQEITEAYIRTLGKIEYLIEWARK